MGVFDTLDWFAICSKRDVHSPMDAGNLLMQVRNSVDLVLRLNIKKKRDHILKDVPKTTKEVQARSNQSGGKVKLEFQSS